MRVRGPGKHGPVFRMAQLTLETSLGRPKATKSFWVGDNLLLLGSQRGDIRDGKEWFLCCVVFFSRNAGDSKGELGRHGDLDQQRHTAASMIEGDGEDGALVSGTHLLSPHTPSQAPYF